MHFIVSDLQELSPHALYMRLKRLCSRTTSGKLQVSPEINEMWLTGCRDTLLLALTKALKGHGFDHSAATRQAVRVPGLKIKMKKQRIHKIKIEFYFRHNSLFPIKLPYLKIVTLQADFQEQVVRIREQSRQRDELLEGGWYTEEALEKECKFSKTLGIKNCMVSYHSNLLF